MHRQAVLLDHNTSMELDIQDASSWDQKPAYVTSVGPLTQISIVTFNVSKMNLLCIFFYIYVIGYLDC